MTKQELAQMLNGMQYNDTIDIDLLKLAKEYEFIIVYGHSDDLMIISGAVEGSVDCYGGGEVYFLHGDLLEFPCNDEYPECQYIQKCIKDAYSVKAIWGNSEYSWIYETKIPHVIFDIMEDEEKYCRGIIFDLEDIQ